MSSHTKRIKWGACTVGALTAAVLAMSTTPAAANGTYSGLEYVYGAGAWSDDWGNEGVVDTNTNRTSNATCLWQMVLWANGYLSSNSDIDGDFGSGTKTATANWQSASGLTADGSAGKASWSHAAGRINYSSGTESDLYLTYVGSAGRSFILHRFPDGVYQFVDADGASRNAGYNYRTCS
ncbi:peptidoglycan-binding protein [Actinacidiphila glaucinigra]|uniref:peptidoglycan-binding domain-containing protein n=1 Tax=Actinacidiphila glaucinigra TaxID=235986 RepID=UPI0036AF403F